MIKLVMAAVSLSALGGSVLAAVSSPDGLAWSDPVDANSAPGDDEVSFDKQWLVCDNGAASPFRGRCYLAYTDFVRGGLSLQSSTDGGLTWSPPVSIAPLALVGAFPAIQPDGTVVIVFRTGERTLELRATRSRDGGASLEPPVLVAPFEAYVVGLRLPALPSVDVDRTGRIWVAWHACDLRPACTGNDVVVSSSADGISWAPTRRVTTGRTAAIPAIAADPASDRIAILYYAVGSGGIDAELVESRNAGDTWGLPQRLSAQTMPRAWLANTNQGRMLADYVSVSWAGGRPLAVWALASEPVGRELRQAIFATRG